MHLPRRKATLTYCTFRTKNVHSPFINDEEITLKILKSAFLVSTLAFLLPAAAHAEAVCPPASAVQFTPFDTSMNSGYGYWSAYAADGTFFGTESFMILNATDAAQGYTATFSEIVDPFGDSFPWGPYAMPLRCKYTLKNATTDQTLGHITLVNQPW